MTKTGEKLQGRLISACLGSIKDAVLILTRELIETGVKLESINVDHWPRYNGNQIDFKIWDGNDHVRKPKGLGIFLTIDDIVTIAKRRQILKRKFNGI